MATTAQIKGFKFEIFGVKEMMDLLEQLPTISMQKTVIRNAEKKALQPVLDAALLTVPRGPTGNLMKSMRISSSLKASQRKGLRRSREVGTTMYVGSTAPHAHLIEFGTVVRETKAEANRGKMTPNPFMTRAWEAGRGSILKIFAEEMKIQLYKAAKRLAHRAATGKLTAAQIRGLR